MSIENEYEEIYQRVLLEVCDSLEARRNKQNLPIREAEDTLKHLYISQGNNWVGRGAVEELTMDATIAGYEQKIAQWKNEEGKA